MIAELPGSEPGAVVMLGAHLDSVLDGPGINDDGSGVAALLEIAEALGGHAAASDDQACLLERRGGRAARLVPLRDRPVRRAAPVDRCLPQRRHARLAERLRRRLRRVRRAPAGSNALRALVEAGVERAGGTPIGVDLGGGSDHRAFGEAGIPTGGVFAGAVDPVTTDQAATSGAIAGRPADTCYHQPCDDVDNANVALARVLTAALADVTVRLANNPELLGR